MRGGYFRVYRSLFDPAGEWHPATTGEPANRAYAWMDMLSMARYEPEGELDRGELYGSARTFAKRWNWKRTKANKFMKRLADANAIKVRTQSGRKASVVSICNYDTYQLDGETARTQVAQTADAKASPTRTRRSNKAVKEEVSEPQTTWLTPYFDAWKDRFGSESEPPIGKMAKVLGPLHKKHGGTEVPPRWTYFLSKQELQFYNLFRFSEAYGSWLPESEPMSSLGSETFWTPPK